MDATSEFCIGPVTMIDFLPILVRTVSAFGSKKRVKNRILGSVLLPLSLHCISVRFAAATPIYGLGGANPAYFIHSFIDNTCIIFDYYDAGRTLWFSVVD